MSSIRWMTEITHSLDFLKFGAERALSLIGAIRDLPRVASVMKNRPYTPPLSANLPLIPSEIFLAAMRDIGSFFEFIPAVRPLLKGKLKKEPVVSKRIGMVTYATFTGIETFILVPQRWNLLGLGRWTATVGGKMALSKIALIKDCFVTITLSLDIFNSKKEIIKNERQLHKKRDNIEAFIELKTLLNSEKTLSKEIIEKIKPLIKNKQGHSEKLLSLHKKIESLQQARLSISDDLKLKKIEAKLAKHQEKIARITLWQSNLESNNVEAFRKLVIYKIEKCKITFDNLEIEQKKRKRERLFNISIVVTVILSNMLKWGTALAIAPLFGISYLTIEALLFLGNWIAQLASGVLGIGTLVAAVRTRHPLALPETHFMKV